MQSAVEAIRAQLFALRDERYKLFHQRLMPTIEHERVIGVRVPALRKLALRLAGTPQAEEFLRVLPHYYYEENNLHAFIIERVKSYDEAIDAVETFLPYIDNWATCDSLSPKVFGGQKPELLAHIRRWLASGHTYTVRFGIGQLMRWYIDDSFEPEYLAWVAGVKSEEYYINMMRAWYFATALAKQPQAAWPWLEQGCLDVWTHNKTIQKAIESYRISAQDKQRLRAMRR